MRYILLATLFSLGLTASIQTAIAQPATPSSKLVSGLPVETVTVIATKPSEKTIKNFVETRGAVSNYRLARIARWTWKICPQTIGLGDKYAEYVSQRIRDIAADAGAPVNPDPACRPNIEVVFTTSPQELIDTIRKTDPIYLGFHQTRSELAALARVVHPIQAWYTTMSVASTSTPSTTHAPQGTANTGNVLDPTMALDVGMECPPGPVVGLGTQGGGGIAIKHAQWRGGVVVSAGGVHELEFPCYNVPSGSLRRAEDGLSSDFFNILIVAEPAKLQDYEVGALADYITMLVLSQPTSVDVCQELPSISNLLVPGCTAVPGRITDGDLAYLDALYSLPGGNLLSTQRDYLRMEMFKTLVTEKSGVN